MYKRLMITNGILGLSIIAVVLSGTQQTTQAYLSDPNPGPYITCTEDCDLSKIQKYVQLNEITSGFRGVIKIVSKTCIPNRNCRGCNVDIQWFNPVTGELYRTESKTAPCKRRYMTRSFNDSTPINRPRDILDGTSNTRSWVVTPPPPIPHHSIWDWD